MPHTLIKSLVVDQVASEHFATSCLYFVLLYM